MLRVGDRVREEGRGLGTIKAIHTKGTADVLFDGAEYAIRRQEHQLQRVRPNPYRRNGEVVGFRRKKGLSKRARAALPNDDFCILSTTRSGKKKRSFPVNDFYHGRLALIYAMWPNNARNREKVKECVFARYPALIDWWNSTDFVDENPNQYYEKTEYRRVANPHHPMHIHWKDVNGGPYRNMHHMRLNPRHYEEDLFEDDSSEELYSDEDSFDESSSDDDYY